MDEFFQTLRKWEMEAYDQLSPEMRAAVQEYGCLPCNPHITVNEYIAWEEQRRVRPQLKVLAGEFQ